MKKYKMTPEEQKQLDDNWEYLCGLWISDITGKIVNEERYEQEKQELKEHREQLGVSGDGVVDNLGGDGGSGLNKQRYVHFASFRHGDK